MRRLGHGMTTSAAKLQYWKTVRAAPFQAASKTLPTPFRDLFARPFQAPSKTLPTPFQDLFAPPYTPPGPGTGLAGWKPENSSAVSEDRKDTGGTRSLTFAKSRKGSPAPAPGPLAPQCQLARPGGRLPVLGAV